MNEQSSCGQTCGGGGCSAAGSGGAIGLAEAVRRYEVEAVSGILNTGRYRLPYFVWGEGPPLVFIHGAGDISRSFVMVMSRLSGHFRCVGYNLPSGHGDGAVLRRYTHDHLVSDFWALADHLKLERAYVLGSSFGSTITVRAMRQRPERIPRAILQGGLARRPLRLLERAFAWIFRRSYGPTAKMPRRSRILELVHQKPFAHQPAEVWRAYVEWTGEARLSALGYQAKWLHGIDLRPDLPQVRQPVLLLVGDRDAVIPRPHAEMLLAGLPNAGMVVIEGAGHVPYYTHPEAMAEVVRQFLTPPGQGRGGQAACEHHPASGGR